MDIAVINKIDSLVMPAIKDRNLTAPPASPSEGDRYLIAAGGSGDWNGHDGEVAAYYDEWIFLPPKEGWTLWVDDEDVLIGYGGSTWAIIGIGQVRKSIDFSGAKLERGATAPTEVPVGNYTTWEYGIGDDSIIDAYQVPHDWVAATDLDYSVHYQIDEAYATVNGEVRFQVGWGATPDDESEPIDAPTHSGSLQSADDNIPATAKTLTTLVVGSISGAGLSAHDEIGHVLSRIALVGGEQPNRGTWRHSCPCGIYCVEERSTIARTEEEDDGEHTEP